MPLAGFLRASISFVRTVPFAIGTFAQTLLAKIWLFLDSSELRSSLLTGLFFIFEMNLIPRIISANLSLVREAGTSGPKSYLLRQTWTSMILAPMVTAAREGHISPEWSDRPTTGYF